MMFCGHCMMDVPEQAKFCLKCGTRLGKMTCGACGVTLPRGSQFCPECGARLGENGEQLFKVTFDRESAKLLDNPPSKIVIDQKRKEVLKNGEILDVYLSKGEHAIEIRCLEESQYNDTINIRKDRVISIARGKLWGEWCVEYSD